MQTFIRRYWPIALFISIYIFIFRKVFFSGLVPFPGDLLVARFFPYYSGGWEGYSPWITYKEYILADVVRQIFPWRLLAMDLVKQGIAPLWNIYAFSGNPLLANLQSAVLYPLNILFLFLKPQWAWITYIMLQPFLAALFMYMFIKSVRLSTVAALFAGLGFAFIGYIMVWFEMGTLGHAALWLPFILWGITKYVDTKKLIFPALAACGITFSIFAGHAQTTAYVILFSYIYFIFAGWKKLSRKEILQGFTVLSLGFFIAAVQILPTLELMQFSARDPLSSSKAYFKFVTPWSHIAMLFAPDFFGNPAAGNFWGKDYGEFMSYAGLVVLLFAFIGFYAYFKEKFMRLLLAITVTSFLVAFPTPFPKILFQLHIPVLSTSLPSRTIFLAAVCFVIAAAYGLEAVLKNKKRLYYPIIFLLGIYAVLWLSTFIAPIDAAKRAVAQKNLILPTGIIFITSIMILGKRVVEKRFSKYALVLCSVLFIFMGIEYSYYLNKYLPMAPIQYIFPQHIFLDELSKLNKTDRVYGYDTSRMETNFSVQWRLLNPEGYDPLYIRSYSELMYAGKTGKFEKDLPRSDALFTESLPTSDSYEKQTLMNILGVKYTLDKDDLMPNKWDPRPDRFPPDRFRLVSQVEKWKIYENLKTLPRAAVFYDYIVEKENDEKISTLFDRKFAYNKKLLLEDSLSFKSHDTSITPAKITQYTANKIKIEVDAKQPGVLFLSDNYYPGWKAYIDGEPAKILRANYSFRSVELSAGNHTIEFVYKPYSFYLGIMITILSAGYLIYIVKKGRLI